MGSDKECLSLFVAGRRLELVEDRKSWYERVVRVLQDTGALVEELRYGGTNLYRGFPERVCLYRLPNDWGIDDWVMVADENPDLVVRRWKYRGHEGGGVLSQQGHAGRGWWENEYVSVGGGEWRLRRMMLSQETQDGLVVRMEVQLRQSENNEVEVWMRGVGGKGEWTLGTNDVVTKAGWCKNGSKTEVMMRNVMEGGVTFGFGLVSVARELVPNIQEVQEMEAWMEGLPGGEKTGYRLELEPGDEGERG